MTRASSPYSALAAWIEDQSFLEAWRESFAADHALLAAGSEQNAADVRTTLLPLIERHPLAKFIEARLAQSDARRLESAMAAWRGLDKVSLHAPHRMLAELFAEERAGTLAAELESSVSRHRDDAYGDLVEGFRGDATDPPPADLAKRLLAVSPDSPLAAVAMVKHAWPQAKANAERWERRHAAHVEVQAVLGDRYLAERRFEDARRCLTRFVRMSPDEFGYTRLAETYKAQCDTERWLATLEEFVRQQSDDPTAAGGVETTRSPGTSSSSASWRGRCPTRNRRPRAVYSTARWPQPSVTNTPRIGRWRKSFIATRTSVPMAATRRTGLRFAFARATAAPTRRGRGRPKPPASRPPTRRPTCWPARDTPICCLGSLGRPCDGCIEAWIRAATRLRRFTVACWRSSKNSPPSPMRPSSGRWPSREATSRIWPAWRNGSTRSFAAGKRRSTTARSSGWRRSLRRPREPMDFISPDGCSKFKAIAAGPARCCAAARHAPRRAWAALWPAPLFAPRAKNPTTCGLKASGKTRKSALLQFRGAA